MPKKIKMLAPSYFKKFKCTGSECEDTCCKTWDIAVDKKTYKKYKAIPKEQFNPLDDKRVILNKENNGTYDYAMINKISRIKDVKTTGKNSEIHMLEMVCPFLTEDNLCGIYKKLGWDYMSDLCKSYPRVIYNIDKEYEIGLMPSCIEAAKLILDDVDGIKFEEVEIDFEEYIKNCPKVNLRSLATDTFYEVRVVSLKILQNKRYNMGKKILILSLMYEKLSEIFNKNHIGEMRELLKKYIYLIESSEDIFKGIEPDISIQLLYTKLIVREILAKNISLSDKMRIFFENTIKMLSEDEEIENSDYKEININSNILKRVEDISNEYMNDFLQDENIKMLFENFIVNHFYIRKMPFISKTIKNACSELAIIYNLFKYFAYGLYYDKKEKIDKKEIIYIAQIITREFIQYKKYDSFVEDIRKYLKLDDISNLSKFVLE